jgi:hypothetical protein
MKKLTIVLLCMSLAAGCLAKLVTRNGELAALDYDDILNYIRKVEKEGFRQVDFEKFAIDRKVGRKNVLIMGAIQEDLNWISVVFLGAALGVVILKWPKKTAL